MGGHFDLDTKKIKLKKLEKEINEPNFWNDVNKSNQINKEYINLKKQIENVILINNNIDDLLELLNIIDDNDIKEIEEDINEINKKIKAQETETLLSGKYDNMDCFLEIHPGAGGTESCDWADMLLRMYTMFCEKNNYKYSIIDKQKGDTAGIKSVMMSIKGYYPYGYFKSEIGVHRLVRISPFNAAGKRQTSFASVRVLPSIDKDINIDIKDEDLRIDVYRSSGCGGQGVNTTDSAVRITHIPTNIVVTCQNERSQLKNKEIALNILKSKLFTLEMEQKKQEINNLKGNEMNINFGSQIRNYTLEPYSLVKDLRTNYENTNTDKVLNGDILGFMESYLRIKR